MNTLELAEAYNSDILKAEEDIKNSNIISHQDVKSKIEEWKIKSISNN
jgi:hypothetical protein